MSVWCRMLLKRYIVIGWNIDSAQLGNCVLPNDLKSYLDQIDFIRLHEDQIQGFQLICKCWNVSSPFCRSLRIKFVSYELISRTNRPKNAFSPNVSFHFSFWLRFTKSLHPRPNRSNIKRSASSCTNLFIRLAFFAVVANFVAPLWLSIL